MGIIPLIPEGGAGSIKKILSGKVAWVDASTGDDVAASADTYDRAKPWQTITAALAAVSSGDVVAVFPGVYAESLTVPAGVVLEASAEAGEVFITGAIATGARLTLSNGSILRNLRVTAPTDAVGAVVCPDGISAEIQGLQIDGNGVAGHGIVKQGLGILSFARVRLMSGDIGSVVRYEGAGGALIGEQLTCIMTGTANIIVDAAGVGMVKMRTIAAAFPLVYQEGIRCAANSTVKLGASSLVQADVGIRITGNGVDFDSARVALDSTTLDVLVDPAVTALARFVLTGARFVYALIDLPDVIAADGAVYLEGADTQDGEPGKLIAGKLNVGTFRAGRRTELGEGGAHTIDMVVLANTSGEGGAWTDNTAAAQSASGSTFPAFSALAIGARLFVGGSKTFPGFVDQVTAALNLGAGALAWEFWNGVAWEAIPIMVTGEESFVSHAQAWGQVVEVENIRFCVPVTWLKKTLNGFDRFWISARVTAAITTSPTLESVSLLPNNARINNQGHLEFFGNAEPFRQLPGLSIENLVPVTGAVPADHPLNFSPSVKFNIVDNQFNNGTVDSAGGLFIIPHGLDTSCPVEIRFRWACTTVDVGDVEWRLTFSRASIGDALSSTLPEVTSTKVLTIAAASTDVIQPEVVFLIDLSDALEDDQVGVVISRDATNGNDPPDTLAAAVYLTKVSAEAYHWT